MQASLLISNKYPLVSNDLAYSKLDTFADSSNFLTKTNNCAFRIKMVRRAGLVKILILEIVLRKCPHHRFFLVETIHYLAYCPN